MKAILYKTDSLNRKASILDVPDNLHGMEWFAKQIGCEWVEIVRPKRLPHGYVMLVDEMGMYTDKKPNLLGCFLYGTDIHGSPIIGDILIVCEKECDLCGLSDVQVAHIMEMYDLHTD